MRKIILMMGIFWGIGAWGQSTQGHAQPQLQRRWGRSLQQSTFTGWRTLYTPLVVNVDNTTVDISDCMRNISDVYYQSYRHSIPFLYQGRRIYITPYLYQRQRGYVISILGQIYFLPQALGQHTTYRSDGDEYFLYSFTTPFHQKICLGILNRNPVDVVDVMEVQGPGCSRQTTDFRQHRINPADFRRFNNRGRPQILSVAAGRQAAADVLTLLLASPLGFDRVRPTTSAGKNAACRDAMLSFLQCRNASGLNTQGQPTPVLNSQGQDINALVRDRRMYIESHSVCNEYCTEHPVDCPLRRQQGTGAAPPTSAVVPSGSTPPHDAGTAPAH